jgi:23S rRNA (guanosine2251-2'-O)-methyltransferase
VSESIVLEGMIAVTAALEAQCRDIHMIYIRDEKRDADALRIGRLAASARVPVERVSADIIAQHASGGTHGGILALVGERRYVDFEALISHSAPPFVVMLDGVEDPFNFGQAIRACYVAGAHGLVIRARNWQQSAGVVARASAGAAERMATAVADSADEAAAYFRSRGLRIAVSDSQRAVSIYEADLTQPLFLLIGGERRGITRAFADKADLRLKIPYGRPFDYALGTTVATAALVFEVMRQRQKHR